MTGCGELWIVLSRFPAQRPCVRPANRGDIFHGGRCHVPRHLDVLIILVPFFLAQLILCFMHLLEGIDTGIRGRIGVSLQNLEDLIDPDAQRIDRWVVIIGFGPSVLGMSQDRKGERDGQKEGGHKATLDHDGMIRGK